jgi:hypothetical protein
MRSQNGVIGLLPFGKASWPDTTRRRTGGAIGPFLHLAAVLAHRHAALYITTLPKAEHDATEWQAAMEALLLVAELGGPTMFARIGVMRALNRHVERAFNPDRKETHWKRRKLARDR